MNQQAIDILDEIMIEANNISIEQGCSEIDYDYRQLLQKAKSRIQALGDGGGLFIIPGKTYYIGDNKTPAVALFPRFQYSNGTIDTIHHTNVSELPPNK